MTPRQIELVQSSFKKVLPISDMAAEIFYKRLFEIDPALEKLFHGDMKQQGKKLMQMLAAAVHNLNRPGALLPAVEALGARHAGYGVTEKHFEAVGGALLWTLARGLQEEFTSEVETAWTEAYVALSAVMKRAAFGKAGAGAQRARA
jgi:hemoglobin-like flavoprotein